MVVTFGVPAVSIEEPAAFYGFLIWAAWLSSFDCYSVLKSHKNKSGEHEDKNRLWVVPLGTVTGRIYQILSKRKHRNSRYAAFFAENKQLFDVTLKTLLTTVRTIKVNYWMLITFKGG